jgi:transposase
VESSEGRLQLFFLPGYSPELNPDEFVWKYVKHQKVGRQTVTDKADLTVKVMRCLRSLQKLPALVRSFFRAPAVAMRHCEMSTCQRSAFNRVCG